MFKDIADKIEDPKITAITNIASGLNIFKKTVKSIKEYHLLKDCNLEDITSRVDEMVNKHYDYRYQHPLDNPVAIYLMEIERRKAPISNQTRKIIIKNKFFWAKKILESMSYNF